MGVYNNNNGVLTPIANETQFIAPVNEYVTKPELEAIVPSDTSVDNKLVNDDKLVEAVDNLGFVTPEQFGAKGDGVTNDAEAFQAALDTCTTIYLSDKTYFLGDSVIDCSDKISIEIIGNNRKSILKGGTFLISIDDTWTKNRDNDTRADMRFPSRFVGIDFTRTNYHHIPAIICVSPIIVENCRILAKRFVVFPNTTYVDRVNFFECNFQYDSSTPTELIMGCDGVEQYSDWMGKGDDWVFRNCSFPAASSSPSFHVSDGNHCVTFNNCINPCVCYGSDNIYKNCPQIYFNECHIEPWNNICFPKEGYENKWAVINYNNCFFHYYSKFNDADMFSGLNTYQGMNVTYLNNTDVGLLPNEIQRFNGVIIPYGSARKHKKDTLTQYHIPASNLRDVLLYDNTESRTKVTPLTDNYNYAFYYSDNANTYDITTKILHENISPNDKSYISWVIKGGTSDNFFLHVFRKNLNTNQVQKCVVYVGYSWLGDIFSWKVYAVQDGGNAFDGVYKWVDYDGEFPT